MLYAKLWAIYALNFYCSEYFFIPYFFKVIMLSKITKVVNSLRFAHILIFNWAQPKILSVKASHSLDFYFKMCFNYDLVEP